MTHALPSPDSTEKAGKPAGPSTGLLGDVHIVRIGDSLAGDLLVSLLSEHGASSTRFERHDSDGITEHLARASVVIDDTGSSQRLSPQPDGRAGLRQLAPYAVFCSLIGLPITAPQSWQSLDDEVVSAVLGLNSLGGEPLEPESLPVGSYYGALLGAVYIAAALVGGAANRPYDIEISLAAAALTVLSRDTLQLDDPRLVDIADLPHLPHVQIFRCADGKYLQPHGLYDHFVETICQVAGHPEWVTGAIDALHCRITRSEQDDWSRRLQEVFATRPAREWEEEINSAGGACTVVRSRQEWEAETHPRSARILSAGEPQGRISIGPGVTIASRSSTRPQPNRPTRGDFTEGGLPLSGIRVIDFCIVLAGPTCARILADLGADVVKVDAPDRFVSAYPWLDVNRNKRSIIINLRTAPGLAIAHQLVETADVVVQNFRSGKLEELGLGEDRLTGSRRDLVYASLNAFDFNGPWETRAGWEHNAQAASGQQHYRRRDHVPQQVPYPVNDYATGLFGAFGILLALRHRRATGAGAHVRGSLARSATVLQNIAEERHNSGRAERYTQIACQDGSVWVRTTAEQGKSTIVSECMSAATSRPCREVEDVLRRHGVFVVPELGLDHPDLRRWLIRDGQIRHWSHPRLGWMQQITPRAHAHGLHRETEWPAPEPGKDTATILQDLGVTADTIDSLTETGTIAGCRQFFPNVVL